VVQIETGLKPKALLKALNEIENDFGRIRLQRWAPRTLDIDIITFGHELIETKSLIVPHPRAFERRFVLVPWLEIDPDAILPGRGRVAALVAELSDVVAVAK
jgi:2-amino-4-hydroxy-6-hydroxymethyldihydropteridine diphosphokinase